MRQIKFRGWHIGLNKMFSAEEMGQDQLTIMPDGQGFINVDSQSTKNSQLVADMIPMQFTGLHDKAGIEIYEGDVLKIKISSSHYSTYEVYWREASFHLIHAKREGDEYGVYGRNFPLRCDEYEVIGNRYENPLLVTANQ